MSRKDTIIIALLINAGLLALLFMLAINTDEDSVSDQSEINKVIAENPVQAPVQKNYIPQVASPVIHQEEVDEVEQFFGGLPPQESFRPILIDDEGYVELEKEPQLLVKPSAPIERKVPNDVRYVEVTVKRGDALERIARNNGTTVEVIKTVNHLTSTRLTVGQVLRVPVSKEQTAKESPPTKITANTSNVVEKKIAANGEPQYYTVKTGDSPWKIAKQFHVNFEDFLRLNNLDEEKARNLKIGDKIRVK